MIARMSRELAAGDRIGPYELAFRLGKGGMGEVWAAVQRREEFGFRKVVALKVLTKEGDANTIAMFLDEAQAASVLQHASVVQTLDLGKTEDRLYIAMDLVRGPALTSLLQRLVIGGGSLTPAIVAHLGIQIASALDYAHVRATHEGKRLALVHRDVSPHNVLLDFNGAVRLTDFGVARSAIQTHESRVGTVRGKPSYMAPEQVMGEAVDARSDVFALGVVLYESACLKRLFGRKKPVDAMAAVLEHRPRPLAEEAPGFPERLARAIEKALEKSPAARHQSAAEMAEALEDASRGLDGFASASRDLVRVLERNFDPAEFDIERRFELAPGASRARRADARAFSGNYAPDPLAPEALAEARTELRDLARSPAPILGAATTGALAAEGAIAVGRARSRVAALVLAVAASVLLALAALVVKRARPTAPTKVAESSPEVAPRPAPAARPSASPAPGAAETIEEPRANEREARATSGDASAGVEARSEPRLARPTAKGDPARRTTRDATPGAESPGGMEKRSGATFEEVRELLNRVKAVDPERGRAMFATLIEAGRENTETLERLGREARAILERADDR